MYRPYMPYIDSCEFCEVDSAAEALFWAMFTMTDAESGDLPNMEVTKEVKNHHFISESVGKLVLVGMEH